MKEGKNWTKWLYWLIFAVVVMIIYKTLNNFNDISTWMGKLISIIMPFISGILLAYLFYIPARAIENLYKKIKIFKKHARGLAIFTIYIMAILVVIIIINIVLPAVSNSVVELANNLPDYYNSAIKYVKDMPEGKIIKKEYLESIISNLQQIDITQFLNVENLVTYVKGVMGIASAIFKVFVTIVMSVYILLERAEIGKFIHRINLSLFKKNTSDALDMYFIKGNNILFKYIFSQILDAILVGIIVSIVLAIMKVKYGVLLGFMIGLFNIIPYFGAIIAITIAVIITIFTGGFAQAIWMLVIVVVIQQIDANIINPKIVGNALKISPILTIFAVTIGGAYFGILGMFLAVPVIALIKLLIIDYMNYKIEKKKNEISEE